MDFSGCTMQSDAKLLIMAEIRGNATTAENAPSVVNNVSMHTGSSSNVIYQLVIIMCR